MPMYNWHMAFSKNKPGYFLVNPKKVANIKRLQDISDRLFNEYIDKIGLSEKFLEYIESIKHRARLQELYIKGDRSKSSLISSIDSEIDKFFGNEQTENINKVSAYISKHQGYKIDPKKISVLEFNDILKFIEENAPKVKA